MTHYVMNHYELITSMILTGNELHILFSGVQLRKVSKVWVFEDETK